MGVVMERAAIPVSAVIPTRDRAGVLRTTLLSLAGQSHRPVEVVVVDASANSDTEEMLKAIANEIVVVYKRANGSGAAGQRNQGMTVATQDFILFMDDDIRFESGCIGHIWRAMSSDDGIGGVSAMIINQHYTPPGRISRTMYRVLSGQRLETYAGKVIGPAWNLLPEDDDKLPEFVRCEWLNTTCTLYRRAALPDPVFDSHFKGYSLMEDVALSVTVGRKWELLNARVARIFHDSQPGDHKADLEKLSEMEVTNRYYIMSHILGRSGAVNNLKFIFFELFQLTAAAFNHRSLRLLFKDLRGKWRGFRKRS
jgi:glycosyltransferase involved in cell wall biosynthesis